MKDWRSSIVSEFVSGLNPVTVARDADGLLRDGELGELIESKGFLVLLFEDPASFRFDYENRFREPRERGEELELVVIAPGKEEQIAHIPADVIDGSRRLEFSLRDLLPRFSYDVIRHMPIVLLDEVCRIHEEICDQPLGENQTKDLLLQHVYKIVPSIITEPHSLLRLLYDKHYRETPIPPILDQWLVTLLTRNSNFSDWPLEVLITDRASYWAFLDERWPVFIGKTDGGRDIVQESALPDFRIPGPGDLPFDHDEVRWFIDLLFEEGLLTPVDRSWERAAPKEWIKVGLVDDPEKHRLLSFQRLYEQTVDEIPGEDSTADEWLEFSRRYAQLRQMFLQMSPEQIGEIAGVDEFWQKANAAFRKWLQVGYPRLFNLPSSPPRLPSHIVPFLSRQIKEQNKVAFVLCDGLALEQWFALREELRASGFTGRMDERNMFAMLPSITPISRQAAFSGMLPRYFSQTALQTDRDESHWRAFWENYGLRSQQIGFKAIHGDIEDLEGIEELASTEDITALGITLFKPDNIMHGMHLGAKGMQSSIREWAQQGFPLALLDLLLARGFTVYLSADHGNTEAVGIGKPNEGTIPDARGQRCFIYPDEAFREKHLSEYPEMIPWDFSALPPDMHSVLPPYGQSFWYQGQKLVCHGGDSLEEMVVPFVEIGNLE